MLEIVCICLYSRMLDVLGSTMLRISRLKRLDLTSCYVVLVSWVAMGLKFRALSVNVMTSITRDLLLMMRMWGWGLATMYSVGLGVWGWWCLRVCSVAAWWVDW